jgi:hypothetical protein
MEKWKKKIRWKRTFVIFLITLQTKWEILHFFFAKILSHSAVIYAVRVVKMSPIWSLITEECCLLYSRSRWIIFVTKYYFQNWAPSGSHAARGPYLQLGLFRVMASRAGIVAIATCRTVQCNAMQRSAVIIKILLSVFNESAGNYLRCELLLCLAERRVCVLS